jgi:hypothetical protein
MISEPYNKRQDNTTKYKTRHQNNHTYDLVMGLKLNGTHQLLAYADDVILLGDNTDTIKKNTEILIDASKEVGLEINVDKN